jgi:pentatricopeptide repeat protein
MAFDGPLACCFSPQNRLSQTQPQIPSVGTTEVTYHTLISTFGKGHQSLKAMQVGRNMEEQKIS